MNLRRQAARSAAPRRVKWMLDDVLRPWQPYDPVTSNHTA
jgi:hypothetical protein